MKTVGELIEELKQYNPNDMAAAYAAESVGIVIYPHNKKKAEKKFEKACEDESLTDKEREKICNEYLESVKTNFIYLPYI